MTRSKLHPGDLVVYSKTKVGRHPGPRAREVWPARGGDDYTYVVDKLYAVVGERSDGRLVLRTRRGKLRVLSPDAEGLRRAGWADRIRFRDRWSALRGSGPGEQAQPSP
jgi:hypothetical protein